MSKSKINLIAAIALLAVSGLFSMARSQEDRDKKEINPDKIIHRSRQNPDIFSNQDSHREGKNKARPSRGGNGISYHGGPLLLGTPNVYVIWYGNWSNNSATTIIPTFLWGLSGSPYFHINTTYYNGSSVKASGLFQYVNSITDNYSHGTSLSDAAIQDIVNSAINGDPTGKQSGRLNYDTNALYFVLTSKDVNETSGFCTQYCGWHSSGTINSGQIKYSFVGNPDRCPSACEAQTTSPNSNAGADGMASIIAHELEETVTDPLGNAWYDSRGQENADKCAWTFGTESTANNGSKYNVTLNSGGINYQYLIQRNWVNASGGYCAMSY